jgi:hypothetical protein
MTEVENLELTDDDKMLVCEDGRLMHVTMTGAPPEELSCNNCGKTAAEHRRD